jgi:hypothetical protein
LGNVVERGSVGKMSGIAATKLQGRDVAVKDGVVEESGVAPKVPL